MSPNPPGRAGGVGRALAGDSALTLAQHGLSAAFALASAILVARVLGPPGQGTYSVAATFAGTCLAMARLGLGPSIAYHVSRGEMPPGQAMRLGAALAAAAGSAGALIGLGVITVAPGLLPGVPASSLTIAAVLVPLTLLTNSQVSVLHGARDFFSFNLAMVAAPAGAAAGVVILVWGLGAGVLGALWALLCGQVLALVLTLGPVCRASRSSGSSPQPGGATALLRYGLKAHPFNVLTFVGYRADLFLLNYLATPAAVGVYAIAVAVAEKIWMLSSAVATALMPRIATLRHDEAARRRLTPAAAATVLWIAIATAAALYAVAPWALPALFGGAFAASVGPVRALLPGVALLAASKVLASDLAGRGRPELNTGPTAVSVAVNIGANLILIPRFGATGAAVASSVSYGLGTALKAAVYCRVAGVAPLQLLSPAGIWRRTA